MRKMGIAAAGLAILLGGCAAPRYQAGRDLLKGVTPVFPVRPDSLRAELQFTAYRGGRGSSAGAALAAIPYRRYKLDLFGVLPGVLGASFLWTDTGWALVLFDRDGYVQGAGDKAAIPGMTMGPVSVHDLFSFLWGDFFPGLRDSAAKAGAVFARGPDGELRYRSSDAEWILRLDERTGLVKEACRADSTLRLVYGDYHVEGGRPVPKRVKVYSLGELGLEIRVGKVEDNPAWRRNPFFIKIPKGFERLETLR
jgi:hypothetical protein